MLQIIAARNKVGVIFSEACVKNSVHGGYVYGWGGACVAGGHVWWGACVVGVCMARGACMTGDVWRGGHVYIYFLFEYTVSPKITRMHSSRMHTARLLTVSHSICQGATPCHACPAATHAPCHAHPLPHIPPHAPTTQGAMCGGGCAWQGGMCGKGVCMAGVECRAGGVHGRGGHVWQGDMHGRGHAPWQILRDTVNEWAVRILLECILVFGLFLILPSLTDLSLQQSCVLVNKGSEAFSSWFLIRSIRLVPRS